MPAERDDGGRISAHVQFAGQLTRWMERAGIPDGPTQADLGVGFADIVFAAAEAERALQLLVSTDPTQVAGADEALTHLGYLNALFLSEIKYHLEDLERAWPALEELLAARAGFHDTPDTEDAES